MQWEVSGQNDQFNLVIWAGSFQAQMSIPQQFITLWNTLGLPLLNFCMASPSPTAVPGGIWHQTELLFPLMLDNKPLFFFNSFAGSYVVPWLLYMGKKTLCSSKAFTTCEHLQLWARRPTAAGSQERAAWLLTPARCSCIDTQHLVHAPMGALATKRTFPCNSSRAWKGYDAANKPFSISCFLGGFVAWCCLPRLFSIKCH